jgi:hypothetical protein
MHLRWDDEPVRLSGAAAALAETRFFHSPLAPCLGEAFGGRSAEGEGDGRDHPPGK